MHSSTKAISQQPENLLGFFPRSTLQTINWVLQMKGRFKTEQRQRLGLRKLGDRLCFLSYQSNTTKPAKFTRWEPFGISPQQEAVKDMLGFIHRVDGALPDATTWSHSHTLTSNVISDYTHSLPFSPQHVSGISSPTCSSPLTVLGPCCSFSSPSNALSTKLSPCCSMPQKHPFKLPLNAKASQQ